MSFITTTTTIVIYTSPIHTTSTYTTTNTTINTITNATYTLTTINPATITSSFTITSDTWLLRAAKPKFPRQQRPRQLLEQSKQNQQFTQQQQQNVPAPTQEQTNVQERLEFPVKKKKKKKKKKTFPKTSCVATITITQHTTLIKTL